MVPTLNHQPTYKASKRTAIWPVMEGWRGKQCYFSVVPARHKITLLSSLLMEEEAFTSCRLPPEETLTQFPRTEHDSCRHQALRAQLLLWAFRSYCLAWACKSCTYTKSLSWRSQGATQAIPLHFADKENGSQSSWVAVQDHTKAVRYTELPVNLR